MRAKVPTLISFEPFVILMSFLVIPKGRGTVATGRVEQGVIKAGEEVEILGLSQVSSHNYAAALSLSQFFWRSVAILLEICCILLIGISESCTLNIVLPLSRRFVPVALFG